uniref:Crustacean female sex hormone 1 n=1 Tax=Lysmata vittata TaxID=749979 RepID=A0A7L7YY96_9EUCA|nr:crustacean female sex hormone 1 [Lysmata vittata]
MEQHQSHSKSPLRLCLMAFCLAAFLLQEPSEATLNLPSYQLGSGGWDENIPKHIKWRAEAIRILKQDELSTDKLQYFSEDQVNEASKLEYKVVPEPIMYTSQIIHKGVNCSSIRTGLHKNHIRPELQLHPEWIHTSELIGSCPTHYVTKELPPMYSPSVVVEAVCTCSGSKCSREGHQCLPVSRYMPVWVRQGPNFHVLDVEEITVACACVRRPSVSGNFIYASAVHS